MNKVKVGDKFNKLTLIKHIPVKLVNMKRTHYGLFICECGIEKMLLVHNVTRGNTKSCGCLYKLSNKTNKKRSGKRINVN